MLTIRFGIETVSHRLVSRQRVCTQLVRVFCTNTDKGLLFVIVAFEVSELGNLLQHLYTIVNGVQCAELKDVRIKH